MAEFTETIDDALGTSDAFALALDKAIEASESVAVDDALTIGVARGVVVSDAVVVDDAVESGFVLDAVASDAIAVGDAIDAGLIRGAVASDAVTVSDEVQVTVLHSNAVSDPVVVSDSLRRTALFARGINDAAVATDTLISSATVAFVVANAYALTSTRVRVDFVTPALLNAALTRPENYLFDNLSSGSVDVTPMAVYLPAGQPSPIYVEVETTEHTDGATYQVGLSSAVRGAAGEIGSATPFPYAGIGVTPTLELVLAISPTEVEVHFSEAIANNTSANDVTKYSWTGGLATLAVQSVAGKVVRLQTSTQNPGELYSLTVFGAGSGNLDVATSDAVALTEQVEAEIVTFSYRREVSDAVAVTDEVVRLFTSPFIVANDVVAVQDAIDAKIFTHMTGDVFGTSVNEAYSAQLTPVGTVGPVVWSIAEGVLPLGLRLDQTGLISGEVPENAALGPYPLTIHAIDSSGKIAERKCSLGVGRYVVLLHMNGAPDSTVFVDETGRSWTTVAGAKIVADGAAFGGSAGTFNGNTDYLSTPDSPDFSMGAGDFTLEAFITLGTPLQSFGSIISQREGVFGNHAWTMAVFGSGQRPFFTSNDNANFLVLPETFPSMVTGVRTHIAATKRGDRLFMHVGGVFAGVTTSFPAILDSTWELRVGADGGTSPTMRLNARFDELRVLKGGARYPDAVNFNVANVVESDFTRLRKRLADLVATTDGVSVEVTS